MGVTAEKLGWRDARLSELHRSFGPDVPAVDLDFPLCEYDHGEFVALIEYKHENMAKTSRAHPSLLALARLATASLIPAFLIRYFDDLNCFEAYPLNDHALNLYGKKHVMNRESYKKFLFDLRVWHKNKKISSARGLTRSNGRQSARPA